MGHLSRIAALALLFSALAPAAQAACITPGTERQSFFRTDIDERIQPGKCFKVLIEVSKLGSFAERGSSKVASKVWAGASVEQVFEDMLKEEGRDPKDYELILAVALEEPGLSMVLGFRFHYIEQKYLGPAPSR